MGEITEEERILKQFGDCVGDNIEFGPDYVYEGQRVGKPFDLGHLVAKVGDDAYMIIPESMGLYHLFDGKEVVYVGITKNLRERLRAHLSGTKKFTHVLFFFHGSNLPIDIDYGKLLMYEYRSIRNLKPKYNIVYNGNKI